MDLDLGINVANNKTNEIEEFTKELNNALNEEKILVYRGYDSRKFTNENVDKIWDKKEELISKNINENNINGAEEDKLYEIRSKVAGGIGVLEYNDTYENRTFLTVDYAELPKNVEKGMFFRKVDGKYVFDKQTTEKIYNEMTCFQNELIVKQKEVLNNKRQEGAIYKVTYLEDDCEDWRTELTNKETGEIFQELEFPHDIYHQVGVNSLVKYKNGTYSVVEGTSVYDLYPNIIERYCENEGVYINQNDKYKTAEELYESLNKCNGVINKFIDEIKNLVKLIQSKLSELFEHKL